MYYENNNAYFKDKMSSSVLLGMCGVTVVGMHAKLMVLCFSHISVILVRITVVR